MQMLAAGPWVSLGGKIAARVVLRVQERNDLPSKFVVHDECRDTDEPEKPTCFVTGDWFTVHFYSRCEAMRQFNAAFGRWQDRNNKRVLDQDYDSVFTKTGVLV